MNKPHASGLVFLFREHPVPKSGTATQRTKRHAARDFRTANETKEAQRNSASSSRRNPRAVSAAAVPPYCYQQQGMTAERGAVEAVKAMRIPSAADALGLLWQMRRVAAQSVSNHTAQAVPERKV